MKRRYVFCSAIASAFIVLAIPATASAPLDQYDTFGPQNVVIWDVKTNLHWQRGYSTATSWDDAHAYCQALVLGGVSAGLWRVPSVKELMTLVDEHLTEEYVGTGLVTFAIDREAFPATPNGTFWAYPKVATKAWTVDFSSGESSTTLATTSGNYVRCVH